MAASQFLHVPGYAACLFRRTKPLLVRPGGLISRSERWWKNTSAKWVDDESTWYFPCKGGGSSSITFGYMEHEKDRYNWLAYEFQFVGFDELTEFSETSYKFLFNRLRMTEEMSEAGMTLRMRGASNPGNTGHEWVRSRFINRELWPDGRPYYEEDSDQWLDAPFFIPARLEDNPHVNQKSYMRSLGHLDPVTRQQYLKGNWDAVSGGAQLKREWFKPLSVLPHDVVFGVRHWDLAATVPIEGNSKSKSDFTAGALVLVCSDGRIILHDIVRFQGTPGTVEARVVQTTWEDLTIQGEQGFPILTTMEQEGGASGKIVIDQYANRILAGFPFLGVVSSGKKEFRSIPLANQAEAGNVYVYVDPEQPATSSWIRKFFDEVDLYPYGEHDDQVDAVAGATNHLLSGGFVREAIPAVQNQFAYKERQIENRIGHTAIHRSLPEARSSWRTPALR
jgi:predicted phage terminase large subunit-like protein